MELYRKYRPKKFSQMVGQKSAVAQLENMVESDNIPHAVMLYGSSGCGKTTAARILAHKIGCSPSDIKEYNSADFNGVEDVRKIRQVMNSKGVSGGSRVWILDEVHLCSREAMTALLKHLEEPPDWIYFILCTTHPDKLLPAIHTRCTKLAFGEVSERDLCSLLFDVSLKENAVIIKEALEKIAEQSRGSPRQALVTLQQVMGLPPDQQLDAVQKTEAKREGIEICRLLLDSRTTWPAMAAVIKSVQEEPESLRHMVLAYMTTVLLGGGKAASRAFQCIEIFRDNLYDSKKAGFAANCYAVITGGK